jgi:hypothetical protein
MFNVHDCATGQVQSTVPLTLEDAQKLIKKLIAAKPNHPYMIVTV